jgi:hypothetical protein
VTVTSNTFDSNKSYAVANETGDAVQAQHNWWGDAAGPSTPDRLAGEPVMGKVVYEPWLRDAPRKEKVPDNDPNDRHE